MDGIKLENWKERFNQEVKNIQIEFDSFFKNRRLDEYYQLTIDESDELTLKLGDNLPREIKGRLQQILISTKPEDSI